MTIDTTQPREQAGIDLDKLRAGFEKRYGPRDSFAWLTADGKYKIPSLQSAWEIYQAAAEDVRQAAPEAPDSEQQAGEPTCAMCNDSGIVGYPPDQYEECPDCIKARAATTASASDCRKLGGNCGCPFGQCVNGLDQPATAYSTGRATAPSSNAAPLNEQVVQALWVEAGQEWGEGGRSQSLIFAQKVAALAQQGAAQVCPTCGGSKVDPGGLPICRTCGGAAQAAHAGADTERLAIEAAAKRIYAAFPGADAHPWIEWGNSNMQEEARCQARTAMSAATEQRGKS